MIAVARSFAKIRWIGIHVAALLLVSVAVHAQNSTALPGELQVGDQIFLTVDVANSQASFSDTLKVRDGLVVTLKKFADVSVKGVRRADAKEFMTGVVAKYLVNPTVNATVLIPVGVFGAVLRPNYYSIPADTKLSDVVGMAGYSPIADPGKITVKRQNQTVMSQKEVSSAIVSGKTMNDLPIQASDVVSVGEKGGVNWGLITSLAGLGLAVATFALALLK